MRADLVHLGLVEYDDALRMQRQMVAACHRRAISNQVLVVEHPPVYTMGRRAVPENILASREELEARGVRVFHSDRGGNVTYHGPGQVVVYPILALPRAWQNVGRYVGALEEAMIRTLADFGIPAGRVSGLAGVWVGRDKVGAIGVHLSRWVTSHGLALNVDPDLEMFDHIVPCGIRDRGVTSMARILGHGLDMGRVTGALLGHLSDLLGLTLVWRDIDLETVQVFVFRRRPRDELLAVHRVGSAPFWQPVTGKIEPGETPDEAAVREVAEETGLRGRLLDLHYVNGFALDPEVVQVARCPFPCYVREHGFAIEVSGGAEVRLEPRIHDRFRWVPPREAEALYRWPGSKAGCRRVARRLGLAAFSG